MPLVMHRMMDALREAREVGALILDVDNGDMDGRVRSIDLMMRVIAYLVEQGFEIEHPRSPRDWYSVMVKDDESGRWIPCNITISAGGADNFTNKHAIVYSCTTLEKEDMPKVMNYDHMFQLVRRNMKVARDRSKEYYMIFLHKRRPFVLVRSLCDIKFLRSNPSNPIQIEWNKEMKLRAILSFLHESPEQTFERFRGVLAASFHGIQRTMRVVTIPIRSSSISRMPS